MPVDVGVQLRSDRVGGRETDEGQGVLIDVE